MQRISLLFAVLMLSAGLYAQPWPRQEKYILNNSKRITDASVSLFELHSDYDFPYIIPSREGITEHMLRIANFLEGATMKEFLNADTGEAITDFDKLPEKFQQAQGDFRPYSYEWGVTYSGMLQAAEVTRENVFLDYTRKRMRLLALAWPKASEYNKKVKGYNSPLRRLMNPHNLDVCGAMCAASIRTQMGEGFEYDLRPFINIALKHISEKQYRLNDGTLARNHPYPNTLWLDDLYMAIPALAEGYRLTGEQRYLDDAAKQILQFAERMFVEEIGLFMHGWVESMEHHPRFYWGRANGWATLAMCDLLDVMPTSHPKYNEILHLFKEHCKGLLKFQSGKGLWHQLLDCNDTYLESSATAMFVYGFAKGINKGWLDGKSFGAVSITGWNALSEQINNMGQIENVCVGTSVAFEPAYYYNRHVHAYTAHAYGLVLMAGSEMIRLVEDFKIIQESTLYFHDRK